MVSKIFKKSSKKEIHFSQAVKPLAGVVSRSSTHSGRHVPTLVCTAGPLCDLDTKFPWAEKHNTSLLIIFKTKGKYKKATSCKFPNSQEWQRLSESSTFSCHLALKNQELDTLVRQQHRMKTEKRYLKLALATCLIFSSHLAPDSLPGLFSQHLALAVSHSSCSLFLE